MKIVLDPGHGGNLASKRGFYGSSAEHNEGVNNFLTCKLIKEYLESKYVVEVLMTRNKVEIYPTLASRGALATGADLFYSRHSNAFDGVVRGVEVFVNQHNSKALSLGKAVSLALSNLMGNNNRGAKNGADLPVTKATEGCAVINGAIKAGCPVAVLAEIGFHDNKTDAGILVDKRVQVAELEAETIAKFLGLEVKPVEKRELDTAEKWAVDNGIMRDEKWDEPATRSQMAWWLFMMKRLIDKE